MKVGIKLCISLSSLEMFVEASTQLEVSELEVETILDLNLRVLTIKLEQFKDAELVEGEIR